MLSQSACRLVGLLWGLAALYAIGHAPSSAADNRPVGRPTIASGTPHSEGKKPKLTLDEVIGKENSK